MTSNEIITIAISTLALVVSIVAIGLQYSVRDDVRVKVTHVQFVSLVATDTRPRTATVAFNMTLYNLGNRPVALERVTVSLAEERFDLLKGRATTTCASGGKRYLVPISRATHGQLAIVPTVVSADSMNSEEFVFDLFHFDSERTSVSASGLVCIELQFSTARGAERTLSEPIAILDVGIDRPDNIRVNFESDQFLKLNTPFRVF